MARSLPWLVLLLMFFQLPYYKEEAGPLYLLAKLWPVMLAPLVLYGMVALRLTDRALYLALTVYALGITPFLSMLHLPNDLVDATAAAVKAWPITFYFSAAAALVLLRPSEGLLARSALGLGAATFGLMLLLWVVVPIEWYQPVVSGPNMFSWDDGRGNYIRMPMMLGVFALLWLAVRFAQRREVWAGALLLGGLLAMAFVYKARLPTGVTAMLVVLIFALSLPAAWRWALGALATLPAALAAIFLGPAVPALLAEIFDESLFIRLRSVTAAWNWLLENPWRILFGAGSTSTFSGYTMADHLNSPDFWITDIGWLGILLEYGVVGTALIILIHARALWTAFTLPGADPFRRALGWYVLFEVLCSAVYSVMYAPGPVVTIAAIAWWLALRDAQGVAREEPGLRPQPTARPALAPPAWAAGRVPKGGRA
ncbi:hypothetical protein [Sediminicoccus sp. BL-A-41-H5]|uniref:hypothetical protein n=1 Tax=Sediminicoccus sp. BL-A-41-H5 TaxID=3421106 RepID=UPI003D66E8AA